MADSYPVGIFNADVLKSFDGIMLEFYKSGIIKYSPIFTEEEANSYYGKTHSDWFMTDINRMPSSIKNKLADVGAIYVKLNNFPRKTLKKENNEHIIFFNEYKKLIAKYIDER